MSANTAVVCAWVYLVKVFFLLILYLSLFLYLILIVNLLVSLSMSVFCLFSVRISVLSTVYLLSVFIKVHFCLLVLLYFTEVMIRVSGERKDILNMELGSLFLNLEGLGGATTNWVGKMWIYLLILFILWLLIFILFILCSNSIYFCCPVKFKCSAYFNSSKHKDKNPQKNLPISIQSIFSFTIQA